MNVEIRHTLLKDIKKIPKTAKVKLEETYHALKACEEIAGLSHVKKLKGHEGFYRIKIGDYRLGFLLENDTIILLRFLHRKEIYRFFP